jgi:hypothetical protein
VSRDQIAISYENDRLSAVMASVSTSKVMVKGWLSAERPATLDSASATAVGEWMAGELKRSGMAWAARHGRVVFGVPRGEFVIKRLSFPPGMHASDLPGSVRLQMARQLTVAQENAAIDFVLLPASQPREAGAPAGQAALAAALAGDRLAWRRELCKAAGISLARVGLMSMGTGVLLAEASQQRGTGTLGISIGRGTTEFVIVEDGHVVFARATDIVRPPDAATNLEEFAQRVAVEAKRTWMSYRSLPEAVLVDGSIVLGVDEAAKAVAARCADSLEMPCVPIDLPRFIQAPMEMPASDRSAAAPLFGLLAEPVVGRETLDFLHPRKTPDLQAARRQRVLLAALGAIVVLGSGYTAANFDLSRRRGTLDSLQKQWESQYSRYQDFMRDQSRLAHIRASEETRVDWLSHMRLLIRRLPAPGQVTLASISGSADSNVLYAVPQDAKKKDQYNPAYWGHAVGLSLSVAGRAKERFVADAFRSTLVADERYSLRTRGADTRDRFDWVLSSRLVHVREKDEQPPEKEVAPEKQGGGT